MPPVSFTPHGFQVFRICLPVPSHCSSESLNKKPIVSPGQIRFVEENAKDGTEVGSSLIADDPEVDVGEQSLQWSIQSCGSFDSSSCPFRIRSCTGIIQVIRSEALDFESFTGPRAEIELSVIVQDDGPGRKISDPEVVKVIVRDVNEAPTISKGQVLYVAENSPSGTSVGVINAVDPDVGDTLTFEILGGEEEEEEEDRNTLPFMVASGGELIISSTTENVLDFEGSLPEFNLRIVARDSLNVSSLVETVRVELTDANDAPQISENDDGERQFELRENCVANEEDCMYTFVATDVDSKPGFGEPFAWRILTPSDAEDCPGIFTMNSSSGVLQLSSGEPQLDFEDYQSCSLQVAVTDAGGAERTHNGLSWS